MLFQYTVSTKNGEIKRGEIEAADREEAMKNLLTQDFIIIFLGPKKKKKIFYWSWGRIATLEKVNLVRNLAMMTRAGLSLKESLKIAKEQVFAKRLKKILEDVGKRVEEGESLFSALSSYPKDFSPTFLGLIRVGEESGTLEQRFLHLTIQLEKDYDLKKKVQSALLYPAIVLVLAVSLAFGLAIFLFPKLIVLFEKLDISLPSITRIFLTTISFLSNYTLVIIFSCFILFFLFVFLIHYKKTRPFFHQLYLTLPFFASIARVKNLANFSRTMNTLLKSGLPISCSLEISAQVVSNTIYQKRLKMIIPLIQKGETLSLNLEKFSQEFPLNLTTTISVGEKTGNLEESLSYLADFYEAELDRKVKNLNSILEPILLIIIGLGVGLLAVAIILPIYQFIGQIGQ